jgi:hypothetical protein
MAQRADAASGQARIAQSTSPTPAPSSSTTPVAVATARVDAMLRTGHADPAWFSSSFLAKVSVAQVDGIVASLTSTLGEYRSLEFTPAKFIAHFAKGTDGVAIHLDGDNKIDGLFFMPPVVATSLDEALPVLGKMPGRVSYVVIAGSSERAAVDASEPLAVGSAFKLAVIDALRGEVLRGKRHWGDVVPLRKGWKSLPSGVLQTWPDDIPLTIATYAAQMISISDNTAADALVHIVGPGDLRPYVRHDDTLLTTREVFTLRSTEAGTLRSEYLSAKTAAARSAVLRRVEALPLPAAAQLPSAPDVTLEWHYSVRELCRMLSDVADLPLMAINPGVADPAEFSHVAYKGGSDTGIINLTTLVTTRRGTSLCFSLTVNDAAHPVDDDAVEKAYARVLHSLAPL